MKYIILFIVVVAFIWLGGCYYDSEESLYPQISNSCDTVNVSFGGTTKDILQASCLTCHSSSNAAALGGAIRLENYSDLIIQVNNGKLMGAIRHEPGYSAMPQGGGKLSDCEIIQLQAWINGGALNN